VLVHPPPFVARFNGILEIRNDSFPASETLEDGTLEIRNDSFPASETLEYGILEYGILEIRLVVDQTLEIRNDSFPASKILEDGTLEIRLVVDQTLERTGKSDDSQYIHIWYFQALSSPPRDTAPKKRRSPDLYTVFSYILLYSSTRTIMVSIVR
jgi:hypothetical protein